MTGLVGRLVIIGGFKRQPDASPCHRTILNDPRRTPVSQPYSSQITNEDCSTAFTISVGKQVEQTGHRPLQLCALGGLEIPFHE